MTYDNATGRLQSDGSLTYHWDYNGNLLDGKTAAKVKTFENLYDNANRLKQASAAGSTYTYAYNGLGDRVSQSVLYGATSQYGLDLAAGLTQVLQDGTSTFYYGLGRIAQQSSSGIDYSMTDGLRSLSYLTNSSGGITLTQSNDPYGNVKLSSGKHAITFCFAGE